MNQPHTESLSHHESGPTQAALHGLQIYQNALSKLLAELVEQAKIQHLNCPPNQVQRIDARLNFAFSYFENGLKNIYTWLYNSREDTNFTYDLTEQNKLYLAAFVSGITGCSLAEVGSYIEELNNDKELLQHITSIAAVVNDQGLDPDPRYGRRLGWYAFVRATKPRVVVETGVDKGLGSCVLAAALLRNAAEGHPGKYYGTDINPHAGYLFQGKYKEAGTILYGDSIESLKKLNEKIDIFINDSDHSAEYEASEYETVRGALSDNAILLADNAHSTDCLAKFSQKAGRNFLFFQEKPKDHWYPGAGIGVCFNALRRQDRGETKIVSTEPEKTAKAESKPVQSPQAPVELTQEVVTLHSPLKEIRQKRCLFLNTYYEAFLNFIYQSNPNLTELSYEEQLDFLQAQSFGDSDFYSKGMISAGWDAQNLIINCAPLQARWAMENNFRGNMHEIFLEQVRRYAPDVVYCQDMHMMSKDLLDRIKQTGAIIAGQIASSMGNIPIQSYDVLFSCVLPFVEWFRTLGVTAYFQPLAFEKSLVDKIKAPEFKSRPIACSFAGGIYSDVHKQRQELLEYLAGKAPIDFWGYGANQLPPDSKIIPRYKGEAWGNDMFNVLFNSKITVNSHGECTGCEGPLVSGKSDNTTKNYAVNMRMYEATGCGAMLVTDYKNNLNDIFEIGKEVVAYRSKEECAELISYYLKFPEEAEKIAKAGQQRTLEEHSYSARLYDAAEVLERKLNYKQIASKLPRLDENKISYGHSSIEPAQVAKELTEAWKNPEIPGKQRALVQDELAKMYKGEVHDVFRRLANMLSPLLTADSKILEIGCASGYNFEILCYLLHKKLNYTGVDYSEAMIDMAKELYPRAKFLAEDGANLSFQDKAFDIAISGNVLIHVPNYKEHIKETCRVSSDYVLAYKTPICKTRPTQTLKKFAYEVETVEFLFNETEIVQCFSDNGWALAQADVLHANPQKDEYSVNYLFIRA